MNNSEIIKICLFSSGDLGKIQ